MNASTAAARAVVAELLRSGVREAVLAPGSRSLPLAMALFDAQAAGSLRLHVRIDERSAGFVALGLAKVSGQPVPVLTTSGTAVANLHPAVLEASHAGVALLTLTADRPAEVRGSGANQTTDQVRLFGTAARSFIDLPAGAGLRSVRSAVSRSVAAALGTLSADPGPVQLNIQFAEPLVPGDESSVAGADVARSGDAAWTTVMSGRRGGAEPVELPLGPRTVVVAGDDAGPPARILAEKAGWPLLAEPTSGSRTGAAPIRTYRLLLDRADLVDSVERVVVFGHPTLSRPVSRLLGRADVDVVVVGPRPQWIDPGRQAGVVAAAVTVPGPDDPAWTERWRRSDAAVSVALDALVAGEPGLTPYEVAAEVSASMPPGGLLVVGSSNPIRDLDLMATAPPVGDRHKTIANRGLAGIDGAVSTAVGAALGRRSPRSVALMGDLTFLHDANGLVLGPDEPRPDLTVVVVNDDGGSIFATLEQGAPEYAESFERVSATPHRVDLAALCAATSTPHRRVHDRAALVDALAQPANGVEVIEVPTDRSRRRDLDRRIRALAIGGGSGGASPAGPPGATE